MKSDDIRGLLKQQYINPCFTYFLAYLPEDNLIVSF